MCSLNMCLAIPMKIKKIEGNFAIVETARLIRRINIQMLPSVEIGDFVLVHAGFAIQKVDKRAAAQTFKEIDSLGD